MMKRSLLFAAFCLSIAAFTRCSSTEDKDPIPVFSVQLYAEMGHSNIDSGGTHSPCMGKGLCSETAELTKGSSAIPVQFSFDRSVQPYVITLRFSLSALVNAQPDRAAEFIGSSGNYPFSAAFLINTADFQLLNIPPAYTQIAATAIGNYTILNDIVTLVLPISQ